MALVPAVHTAPGAVVDGGTFVADRPAWRRTRYQALADALVARRVAPTDAADLALKLLPLPARETRHGDLEDNFNIGNIRPGSAWRGDYDRRAGGLYRAYPSLAAGAQDLVDLLRNRRYGPAWPLLVRGDVAGWYAAIVRAGYYPADEAEVAAARDEYARLYDQARGYGLAYATPALAPRDAWPWLAAAAALGAAAWVLRRGRPW